MSRIQAKKLVEYLKSKHLYFCFGEHGEFYTAEELLSIMLRREVSYDEAIAYLTQ